MKIFVSYSSTDVSLVRDIVAQLKQESFIIMRDQEFLDGGQVFNVRLEQVLRASDVVLLMLTKASTISHWVNEEIVTALEAKKIIIPLKLEADAQAPFGLKTVQYIDFSNDNLRILNYPRLRERLQQIQVEVDHPLPVIAVPPEYTSAEGSNPFVYGSRVKEDLFFGRAEAIKDVVQRVGAAQLQSVSIVANRRMGKSSFLNYLHKMGKRHFPAKQNWTFVYLDMMSARAKTIPNIMATFRSFFLRNLPENLHEFIWRDGDTSLSSFETCIEDLHNEGVSVVLLLDEWEDVQAQIELNEFVNSLRSLGSASQLALITSTAHELVDLYVTSKGLMNRAGKDPSGTSPFYNIFKAPLFLGAMPDNEWQGLVETAFTRSHREIRPRDMKLIGNLSGGLPYFVQLAGFLVWNGIDEGWSEADISMRFSQESEGIFRELWQRETVPNQHRILLERMGVRSADLNQNEVDEAVRKLQVRGILNAQGELFSKAYADFIRHLSI